jgi:hypothetical protein
MKIAHVGGFKGKAERDNGRLLASMLWMLEHKKLDDSKVTHDVINLKYKRDFLRETKTYDMVILHAIMHSNKPSLLKKLIKDRYKDAKLFGYVDISDLHSVPAWRKRLESTKAKHIFIWEDIPSSLNGWTIGKLKGYNRKYIDHYFAVYERI